MGKLFAEVQGRKKGSVYVSSEALHHKHQTGKCLRKNGDRGK